MSPEIRFFREEDLPRVYRIEVSSFTDPWPKSFFKYVNRKAPKLFLLAVEGKEIVGYIIGEIQEIIVSGVSHMYKMGYIMNIAVHRKYRRVGVGTLLMREIERRFKDNKVTQITLHVRESNETGRFFYSSKGFKDIGRVRTYYPDEDAILMSKSLL